MYLFVYFKKKKIMNIVLEFHEKNEDSIFNMQSLI